jgi:hypothetical protein
MNNLNVLLTNKTRELAGTGCVKRVAQWHSENVRARFACKFQTQSRVGPHCYVQFVTSSRESIHKIGEVPFSATNALSRTDLEYFQICGLRSRSIRRFRRFTQIEFLINLRKSAGNVLNDYDIKEIF